jgi:hypothetical protein
MTYSKRGQTQICRFSKFQKQIEFLNFLKNVLKPTLDANLSKAVSINENLDLKVEPDHEITSFLTFISSHG